MDSLKKYGDFDKIPAALPSESMIQLKFQPIDFMTYWRRCGMTADFIGHFYSVIEAGALSEEIMYSLSTIANELIENAVKFSKQKSLVEMTLRFYSQILFIEVTNIISSKTLESFEPLCKEILSSDIEELYFRKLEEKAADDSQSGIGLLMMLKDYSVSLAFGFEKISEENTKAVVRAFVNVKRSN